MRVGARPPAAGATDRERERDAVERPDRDLVAAVRAELAAIEPARRCCRVAERAGLGHVADGRARTPVVGRLVVRLHDPARGATTEFEWSRAATHCRVAWLRGVFLARGSLSLARGRTHLELVVPAAALDEVAERVAEMGLPAGARLRRNRGVLTWKSGETVVGLLRRLGGTAAAMELETRFVSRLLRGHLNRVINAEHANLARSVSSARRQLEQIEVLRATGEWARLPRTVRSVGEARRRAPEATFSELADQLATSRALVQRAFGTIEARASAPSDRRPG